jgi:caspase 7
MTHGEENLLHGRDKPYETHKVWELFTANKCPSLARKPKVFIFQVCKPVKLDVFTVYYPLYYVKKSSSYF